MPWNLPMTHVWFSLVIIEYMSIDGFFAHVYCMLY